MNLDRRSFLLGLAVAGCSREKPSPVETKSAYAALSDPVDAGGDVRVLPGALRVIEWAFEGGAGGAGGATRAAVIVPAGAPTDRFPVLVALHGRGEARKGPERGALGWPQDYALTRAVKRVSAPPLTTADFEGFVSPARLARHNAALSAAPFRGLVVLCPYLPDIDIKDPLALRDYGEWVTGVLLPRARRELPVLTQPAATGIDGVSLGGAVALRVGLAYPEQFAAVGTLQAAIDDPQIPDLVEALRAARARRPSLKLRLLTSTNDYFRRVVTATSQAMRAAGLDHEFLEVPGPHDYPFNRGPGAIEMLLWHDRLLAHA